MPDDRLGQHTAPPPPGLMERLGETVHDAGRLVVDHLALAALEAQRAAGGFVRILIASIVVTILVVATWMAAMVALALWVTNAGMALSTALLCVGALNLALAVAIGLWIRARVPELVFAATLRQLHYNVDKEAWTDDARPLA